MIMLLLLSTLQLSLCATSMARIDDPIFKGNDHVMKDYPLLKEHDPKIITVDGIEGILYDLPEYEDRQLVDYQLAAMGGSPIISLLQLAKKQSEDRDKYIPPKEKYFLLKETLDDVISRLQIVRTKLDIGSGDIHYSDIEKAIQELKKLEPHFRSSIPSIEQLLSSIRQTISIASPIIETDFVSVEEKPPSKPTEASVIGTSEGTYLYTVEEENGAPKTPSHVERDRTENSEKKDGKMGSQQNSFWQHEAKGLQRVSQEYPQVPFWQQQ